MPDKLPPFAFCPWCGRELSADVLAVTEHRTEDDSEEDDMARYEWTTEKDEMVRACLEAGESYADICVKLGVNRKQLSNRLQYLRKKDTGNDYTTKKRLADSPVEEGAGELNDLEKALSELVTELQGEKEKLEAELRDLHDVFEGQCGTINELREKLVAADEALQAALEEAENHRLALSETERQMDEERAQHEHALDDSKKFCDMQAEHDAEIFKTLRNEIDLLNGEHLRVLNIAMGLVEKFVLPRGEAIGHES